MNIRSIWLWISAWPRGLIAWIHMAICALTSDQGRKGWAMLAALGCCVVMTIEVGFVLWVDRDPWHRFLIAMSAQAVNFIVVTGLMVLLGVKRSTKGSITLPGGGSVSLGIDDEGKPVVVTSAPIAPPVPNPAPPVVPNPPPPFPPPLSPGA